MQLIDNSLKVFVGSTYTDLKAYREAVRDALHRLEVIVRGMEYFGSLDGKPVEECLASVKSCSIYIGIFGMRYGSIPKGYQQSMTELEYEEAQYLKLPSLVYILDEENQPVLTKHIDVGEKAEKLIKLKTKLQSTHIVSHFTTEDDLSARVSRDLSNLINKKFSERLAIKEEEIDKFKVQYIKNREAANLHEAFANAQKRIRIIQTNLSTVVSEYLTSIESAIINAKNKGVDLEVSLLTLDPESYFASMRAKQLRKNVQQFRNDMHTALQSICKKLGCYSNVDIRIYDDFPIQICFMIDDDIYHCIVSKERQSRDNCLFKFSSQHPVLFESFVSHFTSVWGDAKPANSYITTSP